MSALEDDLLNPSASTSKSNSGSSSPTGKSGNGRTRKTKKLLQGFCKTSVVLDDNQRQTASTFSRFRPQLQANSVTSPGNSSPIGLGAEPPADKVYKDIKNEFTKLDDLGMKVANNFKTNPHRGHNNTIKERKFFKSVTPIPQIPIKVVDAVPNVADVTKVFKIISSNSPLSGNDSNNSQSCRAPRTVKTYANRRKQASCHSDGVIESFALPDTPIVPQESVLPADKETALDKSLDVGVALDSEVNLSDYWLKDDFPENLCAASNRVAESLNTSYTSSRCNRHIPTLIFVNKPVRLDLNSIQDSIELAEKPLPALDLNLNNNMAPAKQHNKNDTRVPKTLKNGPNGVKVGVVQKVAEFIESVPAVLNGIEKLPLTRETSKRISGHVQVANAIVKGRTQMNSSMEKRSRLRLSPNKPYNQSFDDLGTINMFERLRPTKDTNFNVETRFSENLVKTSQNKQTCVRIDYKVDKPSSSDQNNKQFGTANENLEPKHSERAYSKKNKLSTSEKLQEAKSPSDDEQITVKDDVHRESKKSEEKLKSQDNNEIKQTQNTSLCGTTNLNLEESVNAEDSVQQVMGPLKLKKCQDQVAPGAKVKGSLDLITHSNPPNNSRADVIESEQGLKHASVENSNLECITAQFTLSPEKFYRKEITAEKLRVRKSSRHGGEEMKNVLTIINPETLLRKNREQIRISKNQKAFLTENSKNVTEASTADGANKQKNEVRQKSQQKVHKKQISVAVMTLRRQVQRTRQLCSDTKRRIVLRTKHTEPHRRSSFSLRSKRQVTELMKSKNLSRDLVILVNKDSTKHQGMLNTESSENLEVGNTLQSDPQIVSANKLKPSPKKQHTAAEQINKASVPLKSPRKSQNPLTIQEAASDHEISSTQDSTNLLKVQPMSPEKSGNLSKAAKKSQPEGHNVMNLRRTRSSLNVQPGVEVEKIPEILELPSSTRSKVSCLSSDKSKHSSKNGTADKSTSPETQDKLKMSPGKMRRASVSQMSVEKVDQFDNDPSNLKDVDQRKTRRQSSRNQVAVVETKEWQKNSSPRKRSRHSTSLDTKKSSDAQKNTGSSTETVVKAVNVEAKENGTGETAPEKNLPETTDSFKVQKTSKSMGLSPRKSQVVVTNQESTDQVNDNSTAGSELLADTKLQNTGPRRTRHSSRFEKATVDPNTQTNSEVVAPCKTQLVGSRKSSRFNDQVSAAEAMINLKSPKIPGKIKDAVVRISSDSDLRNNNSDSIAQSDIPITDSEKSEQYANNKSALKEVEASVETQDTLKTTSKSKSKEQSPRKFRHSSVSQVLLQEVDEDSPASSDFFPKSKLQNVSFQRRTRFSSRNQGTSLETECSSDHHRNSELSIPESREKLNQSKKDKQSTSIVAEKAKTQVDSEKALQENEKASLQAKEPLGNDSLVNNESREKLELASGRTMGKVGNQTSQQCTVNQDNSAEEPAIFEEIKKKSGSDKVHKDPEITSVTAAITSNVAVVETEEKKPGRPRKSLRLNQESKIHENGEWGSTRENITDLSKKVDQERSPAAEKIQELNKIGADGSQDASPVKKCGRHVKSLRLSQEYSDKSRTRENLELNSDCRSTTDSFTEFDQEKSLVEEELEKLNTGADEGQVTSPVKKRARPRKSFRVSQENPEKSRIYENGGLSSNCENTTDLLKEINQEKNLVGEEMERSNNKVPVERQDSSSVTKRGRSRKSVQLSQECPEKSRIPGDVLNSNCEDITDLLTAVDHENSLAVEETDKLKIGADGGQDASPVKKRGRPRKNLQLSQEHPEKSTIPENVLNSNCENVTDLLMEVVHEKSLKDEEIDEFNIGAVEGKDASPVKSLRLSQEHPEMSRIPGNVSSSHCENITDSLTGVDHEKSLAEEEEEKLNIGADEGQDPSPVKKRGRPRKKSRLSQKYPEKSRISENVENVLTSDCNHTTDLLVEVDQEKSLVEEEILELNNIGVGHSVTEEKSTTNEVSSENRDTPNSLNFEVEQPIISWLRRPGNPIGKLFTTPSPSLTDSASEKIEPPDDAKSEKFSDSQILPNESDKFSSVETSDIEDDMPLHERLLKTFDKNGFVEKMKSTLELNLTGAVKCSAESPLDKESDSVVQNHLVETSDKSRTDDDVPLKQSLPENSQKSLSENITSQKAVFNLRSQMAKKNLENQSFYSRLPGDTDEVHSAKTSDEDDLPLQCFRENPEKSVFVEENSELISQSCEQENVDEESSVQILDEDDLPLEKLLKSAKNKEQLPDVNSAPNRDSSGGTTTKPNDSEDTSNDEMPLLERLFRVQDAYSSETDNDHKLETIDIPEDGKLSSRNEPENATSGRHKSIEELSSPMPDIVNRSLDSLVTQSKHQAKVPNSVSLTQYDQLYYAQAKVVLNPITWFGPLLPENAEPPMKDEPPDEDSKEGILSKVPTTLEDSTVKDDKSVFKFPTIPTIKLENAQLVEYKVGDLAWAKIGSYPYWPCVVTQEPSTGYHRRTFSNRVYPIFHVRFFGDNGRRAWVSQIWMLAYTTKEDLSQTYNIENNANPLIAWKSDDRRLLNWKVGVDEAESVKTKTVPERLQFFTQQKEEAKLRRLSERRSRKISSHGSSGETPSPRKTRLSQQEQQHKKSESESKVADASFEEDIVPTRKRLRSSVTNSDDLRPSQKRMKREAATQEDTNSEDNHNRKAQKRKLSLDGESEELDNFSGSKPKVKRQNTTNADICGTSEDTDSKFSDNSSVPASLESQAALYRRNKILRGVPKEKACQICEKQGDVFKCKGPCNGMYHFKCVSNDPQPEQSHPQQLESEQPPPVIVKEDAKEEILWENVAAPSTSTATVEPVEQTKAKPLPKISKVEILSLISFKPRPLPVLSSPPNFPQMTLAEQIDYRMKEIMKKFDQEPVYDAGDSQDSSSAEDEFVLDDEKNRLESKKQKSVRKSLDCPAQESTASNEGTKDKNAVKKEIGVIKHVTADDVRYFVLNEDSSVTYVNSSEEETVKQEFERPTQQVTSPQAQPYTTKDFKCKWCAKNEPPLCQVCHQEQSPLGSEFRQKCSLHQCGKYYHPECLNDWPQTQWSVIHSTKDEQSKADYDTFVCPRHVCHTCVSDDPRASKTRCSSDKLVKCLKCPSTYHSLNYCVPAGSDLISTSQIVCPRHHSNNTKRKFMPQIINANWCFICSNGGDLICCETCPTSVHLECLPGNFDQSETFYCEDCQSGRLPLYDEIVWVKLGSYRWWPAVILFPNEVPENLKHLAHNRGEFVVKFFGTYDHYWVGRGRTFLFQEGDAGHHGHARNRVDSAFVKAIEEATAAHQLKKQFKMNKAAEKNMGLKPPPYIRIKVNKPVGNVRQFDGNVSNTTSCNCNPNDAHPCGPDSVCLNRLLMTECNPEMCPAGKRCNNQRFEKREYPPLLPYRTEGRGWGLKTLAPVKRGQFVIEYVGELLDEQEYQRRVEKMHAQKEENYYFLTIDKDRMLDAGPKGNVARFMNHSCQPNCETQKWTVNGDTRVGLFASCDIPANTELTFNYNLECIGKEKKICRCGAPNCSGYIGVKVKTEEGVKKSKKLKSRKRKPLAPAHSVVNDDPCFVCGKMEDVGPCNNKMCTKFYHLGCVGLSSWPEGNKWVCPWHNCNLCSKRTIRCCIECVNSYCPSHSDGNVRYDKMLGFVCAQHDPLLKKPPKDPNIRSSSKKRKRNRNRRTAAARTDNVAAAATGSTAHDNIDSNGDAQEMWSREVKEEELCGALLDSEFGALQSSVTSTPLKKNSVAAAAAAVAEDEVTMLLPSTSGGTNSQESRNDESSDAKVVKGQRPRGRPRKYKKLMTINKGQTLKNVKKGGTGRIRKRPRDASGIKDVKEHNDGSPKSKLEKDSNGELVRVGKQGRPRKYDRDSVKLLVKPKTVNKNLSYSVPGTRKRSRLKKC